MKYIIGILLGVLVGSTPVFAYELFVTEVTEPYEIVSISDIPVSEQVYLGELDNFPIMYEIEASESFAFKAQLTQIYDDDIEPNKFSLMVVRLDDSGGGVTEIARFNPAVADWVELKDSALGLSFWDTVPVVVELEAGMYRIEVSTPENIGRYRLTLGTEEDASGYFKSLSQARTTQKFFGYSFLKMLTSSYVVYPIGIILLLLAFYKTWKYRKTITNFD